ncbi:MAG: 30S ribosomal protein S6 [Syntrophomonadaceae bacterium]|nr:30S ribosomal protein S6 [Syntrophomonadaceae bacterium]
MRPYEMMFILTPELPTESIDAAKDRVSDIITQTGGEFQEFDVWGKRRLAYEINDFREGIYILAHFNGTTETVNEMDRVLKISDSFLRHMIIRKEV